MTFSTDDAFSQFAAHRQAELGQMSQAAEKQKVAPAPRRLTEGEKVNLHTDAKDKASGGIAMAILGAPLLVLFPPAGIAVMAAAAATFSAGVADDIKLERDKNLD